MAGWARVGRTTAQTMPGTTAGLRMMVRITIGRIMTVRIMIAQSGAARHVARSVNSHQKPARCWRSGCRKAASGCSRPERR